MSREAAAVRRRLDGVPAVRLLTTGMGPDAAAEAALSELVPGAEAVVVAGVCGACDPTLAPGTVVVASALCDLGGRPIEVPAVPEAVMQSALADAPAARGRVATGATVVDDPATRARLAAAGVLVAETEAAGWAGPCRRSHVPLLVVRAVLDTPARPLGAAARLVAPGEVGPPARRLLGLALRPGTWTSLPGLARAAALAEGRAAAAAVAAATALVAG